MSQRDRQKELEEIRRENGVMRKLRMHRPMAVKEDLSLNYCDLLEEAWEEWRISHEQRKAYREALCSYLMRGTIHALWKRGEMNRITHGYPQRVGYRWDNGEEE